MAGESLVGVHYATVAPLISIFILGASLAAGVARREAIARRLLKLGVILLLAGWPIYVAAFVAADYRLEEVARTTSDGLSLYLRVGASWSGGGSSIYLFSAILSLALLPVALRGVGGLRAVILTSLIIFLLMVSAALQEAFATGNHYGGLSLNPILRNFWIVPHPLSTFIGYALLLAGSLYLLLGERRIGTPVFVAGWAVLGIGMTLGGLWSYDTFGWGGYWAWDPVETSQLAVWLAATAALHMVGPLGRLRPAFISVTASTVFLATYVTRSGVSPIHSFAAESLAAVIKLVLATAFLGLSILLGAVALEDLLRLEALRSAPFRLRRMGAQGLAAIAGGVAIAVASLVVYSALYVPSIVINLGVDIVLPTFAEGVRFYTPLLAPLAVAGILATAIYYMPRGTPRQAWKVVVAVAFVLTLMGVVAVDKGIWTPSPFTDRPTNFLIAVLTGLSALALGVTASGVAGDVLHIVRSRRASVNSLRILSLRVIHAFLLLAMLGVAISGSYAFNDLYNEKATLTPGESAELVGLEVVFQEYEYYRTGGSIDLKTTLSPGTATVLVGWTGLKMLQDNVAPIVREIMLSGPGLEGNETLESLASVLGRNEIPGPIEAELLVAKYVIVDLERGAMEDPSGAPATLRLVFLDPTLAVDVYPRLDPEARVIGGEVRAGVEARVAWDSGGLVLEELTPERALRLVFEGALAFDGGDIALYIKEANVYTNGEGVYFFEAVKGWLDVGGVRVEIPLTLSLGEYYYLTVKTGESQLVGKMLESSLPTMLEPELLANVLGETPADFRLPLNAPEGAALDITLLIDGEEYKPRVRFEANGEAIGIHGLVIDVIHVRRGLTDIYITVNAPPIQGDFGIYHELLFYYLLEAEKELPREEYLALAALMSAGINIGNIQGLPLPQASIVAAQGLVDFFIILDQMKSGGPWAIESEGIVVTAKVIPGVPLVWIGGLGSSIAGLGLALLYAAQKTREAE